MSLFDIRWMNAQRTLVCSSSTASNNDPSHQGRSDGSIPLSLSIPMCEERTTSE